MARRSSLQAMNDACAAFNAAHPVGSDIRVWSGPIEGEPKTVTVKYPASILSGHTAVVYVTGGHGCIALSHVEHDSARRSSRRSQP